MYQEAIIIRQEINTFNKKVINILVINKLTLKIKETVRLIIHLVEQIVKVMLIGLEIRVINHQSLLYKLIAHSKKQILLLFIKSLDMEPFQIKDLDLMKLKDNK